MGILVSENEKEFDVDDILDEIAASSEQRQARVSQITDALNTLDGIGVTIDWNEFGEHMLKWHHEIFGDKLPPVYEDTLVRNTENHIQKDDDYDNLPF